MDERLPQQMSLGISNQLHISADLPMRECRGMVGTGIPL